MLIIFVLAALALLAAFAIVFVFPIMIVVSLVRARRRKSVGISAQEADPDSAFVVMIDQEWPEEAAALRNGTYPSPH